MLQALFSPLWFGLALLPLQQQYSANCTLPSPQLKVLAICNLAIGMVLGRYRSRLTFSALLVFAVVPSLLTAIARDFNQLVGSSLINSIMGAGFVIGVASTACPNQ